MKQKDISLELMRVIAIFFVIFNHSKAFGAFWKHNYSDVFFWADMSLSVFCKYAVPMFFTISGALLLGKEPDPIKKTWLKRISRYLFILVLYSGLYYLYNLQFDPAKELSVKGYLKEMYTSQVRGHLWFLYQYIAFLMILPVLQATVKHLKNEHFVYVAILSLAFEILACVEFLTNGGAYTVNSLLIPNGLFNKIILYPSMGYYIHNRRGLRKKTIRKLLLAEAAVLLTACVYLHTSKKMTGEMNNQYFNFGVLVTTVSVFYICKYLSGFIKKESFLAKAIMSVGSCTFGIYLLHMFIIDQPIGEILVQKMTDMHMGYMFPNIFWCVVVMAVSYAVTWFLKKIPVVRNYV